MKTVYIGIDPSQIPESKKKVSKSKYGAIAIQEPHKGLEFIKLNLTRSELSVKLLVKIKRWKRKKYKVKIVIEKLWSRNTDALHVSSAWKLCSGYSWILGFLASQALEVTQVAPIVWMGWYGLSKRIEESETAWKTRLWKEALQKSKLPPRILRKPLADSYLILVYCIEN